jgi:hypothetical protein
VSRFDDLLGIDPDAIPFYPGSKQRRDTRQTPADTRQPWQKAFDGLTPRTYQVRGQDTEFFTIGQLAFALERKPVTLRKWEADGVLPKATFLAPNPKKDHRAKRRLYSRAQAEGIVRIAAEEGLIDEARRVLVSQTHFTERVTDLFKELMSK